MKVLQYGLDESRYVHALAVAKGRDSRIDCRIVLDSSALSRPTVRGIGAINLLTAWRIPLRVRNPTGHMFSIQHEKSWLVDAAILLFGSHNGTANSLLNCEENLGAVCDAGVVARASAHFEEVLDRSTAGR